MLTPEQADIRQQLRNFKSVLPDAHTDVNSVLLLSVLDELRVIRSLFEEILKSPQSDNLHQLRDRITTQAGHDDTDAS